MFLKKIFRSSFLLLLLTTPLGIMGNSHSETLPQPSIQYDRVLIGPQEGGAHIHLGDGPVPNIKDTFLTRRFFGESLDSLKEYYSNPAHHLVLLTSQKAN